MSMLSFWVITQMILVGVNDTMYDSLCVFSPQQDSTQTRGKLSFANPLYNYPDANSTDCSGSEA